MVISIILIILFIVGIVFAGFMSISFFDDGMNMRGIIAAAAVFILFISLIVVPFSIRTIDTGEVAVVKHFGVIKEVKGPGMHFDLWITNKYNRYDTKVRTIEIETAAYSADAQTMNVKMTIQYQIMSDAVIDIATQYGDTDILENRITSVAIEKTKATLSTRKAMDIIANRAIISPDVEAIIKDAIGEEYFVNITTVVLTNIDFSDAFELAVEEKMIAEQAKLKADFENETKVAMAKAEAEAKLEAARAEIEIAKAEAEALRITAEAEAAANDIINKSLTDKVLQHIFYEKWDGKLPNAMTGNGSGIIVDIGGIG